MNPVKLDHPTLCRFFFNREKLDQVSIEVHEVLRLAIEGVIAGQWQQVQASSFMEISGIFHGMFMAYTLW